MAAKKKEVVPITTTQLSIEHFNVQLEDYKAIRNDINLLEAYTSSVESINDLLDETLNNYLAIGYELAYVADEKLYLVDGYKDVYEFAFKKFNLSKTTTHNSMAISKKFANKNGNLLHEYDGFNFSQLVELLSVDKLDLDNYKPSMRVKEIRDFKFINSIINKLDISIDKGLIKSLIDYVLNYDWNQKLKTNSFNITYSVNKNDFNEDNYFRLFIEFVLLNSKTKQELKFTIVSRDVSDIDVEKLFSFRDISNFYLWDHFDTFDELDQSLEEICTAWINKSTVISEDKSLDDVKPKVKKESKKLPVPKDYSMYNTVLKSVEDLDIYYNNTGRSHEYYAFNFKPEISKKNPANIIIEGMNSSIFKTEFKHLKGIEDKEPIYEADEQMQQALKDFEAAFKDFVKRHHDTFLQGNQ